MANHCSFVLLAEFHIQEGAQLKYQFPQPLGVDERYHIISLTSFILNQPLFSVLAMSMLPDGAETQLDDWTIFFLNQTSFNTISPVLALDTPEVTPVPLPGEDNGHLTTHRPELLCVLNLVRTKHDKSLNRFYINFSAIQPHDTYLVFFQRSSGSCTCHLHPSFLHPNFQGLHSNTLSKFKLDLTSIESLFFSWLLMIILPTHLKTVWPGSSMLSTQWTFLQPLS